MSANSDCNKNSILIEPYRLDDLYSVNGFFVRYLWKDLYVVGKLSACYHHIYIEHIESKNAQSHVLEFQCIEKMVQFDNILEIEMTSGHCYRFDFCLCGIVSRFLSKAQKEGFIVEERKDFFNLSIIIDEMQKCWKELRVGRRPKFFRTFYVGNDEINKWGNGYGNGYDYIC